MWNTPFKSLGVGGGGKSNTIELTNGMLVTKYNENGFFEDIEIYGENLGSSQNNTPSNPGSCMSEMGNFLGYLNKVKIKNAVTIKGNLLYLPNKFMGMPFTAASSVKIWLPSTLTTIDTSRGNKLPFREGSAGETLGTLYFEHSSKPSGFDSYYDCGYYNSSYTYKFTVMWGVTEDQFDTL